MKKYTVSYVEVWKDDKPVATWFNSKERSGYGSTNNDHEDPKSTFRRLIKDMVIRKVVNLPGNKVTKTSIELIDGYDLSLIHI